MIPVAVFLMGLAVGLSWGVHLGRKDQRLMPECNRIPNDAPDTPPSYENTRFPPGAYLASALAAANISCDSGEDVDRLIDELERRGWTLARSQHKAGPDEPITCPQCGLFVASVEPEKADAK